MIAFCHVQKTAGTTLHRILQRSFGVRHCAVEPMRPFGGALYYETVYSARDHVEVQRLYPRLASIAGHLVKPYSDLATVRPDVRWVLFLRDPIVRSASHYQHMVLRAGYARSCEAWLEEPRFRDMQTRHVAGTADVDAAIELLREREVFVGLQERFDESLVLLERHLAEPRLDIRYRAENRSPESRIRRRVLEAPRSRRALEEANRNDLALYEWVRRELFPAQLRAYGLGLEEALRRQRARGHPPRWSARIVLSRGMRFAVLRPVGRLRRRRRAARPEGRAPEAPSGATRRGERHPGSC